MILVTGGTATWPAARTVPEFVHEYVAAFRG